MLYKGRVIGFLGIVHPNVLKNFDWVHPVSIIEMEVECLIRHLVD